ncbi:MAG: hypothetical protein IE926_08705 [Micrococcales bacterium]|nr:hypothetical protein [Micrococcales bacterium]
MSELGRSAPSTGTPNGKTPRPAGVLRSLVGLLGQGLAGPGRPGGWSVETVVVGFGVVVLLVIALGQAGLI